MDLDLLHEKIRECQLCDLTLNRIKAVPGEGPCPVEIMLVGEAPGREEDLTGRPFVGRAGRLLDVALEALRETLRTRRVSVDALWRFARICRVARVMRPYLEAMA